MKWVKKWMVFCIICLYCKFSFSQDDLPAVIKDSTKNFKLTAFPVLFYLPETGLGYGALGIGTFRLRDEPKESYPSSVQLAVSYTTKNQLLIWAPYELYWDNEKWRLFGELGFYKYFYNFYGLGVQALENNLETYEVSFPRFRASLLREVLPKFLIGAGYELDIFYDLGIASNGILENSNVVGKEGAGTVSNLGVLAVYDSRDHLFQPTKGFFVQGSVFTSADFLGSSFSFSKFSLDARYYQKIKGRHILATNFFMGNMGKGTPFFSLNYLGNNSRSRGFNDRRFQDNGELSMAVEYRFPISGRFGGVGFASTGTVAPNFSGLFSSIYKNAAGLGVRYTINKKDGIRIRIDYGLSEEGGNIYFTVREAF